MRKTLLIIAALMLIVGLAWGQTTNPCEDERYLKIKEKSLDEMSDREYAYFLKFDEKCTDYLESSSTYGGVKSKEPVVKPIGGNTEPDQLSKMSTKQPTVSVPDIDWVFVTGGTFQMGSNSGDDDEKPVHPVSLSDFYISKTEVTYNQYKIFREATGRDNWDASLNTNYNCNKGDYPKVGLDQDDAIAFCDWLGRLIGKTVRLPTEAEWEYAARGGNKSNDHIYSGSNNIDEVAWYWRNSGDEYLNGKHVNILTYYNKYNPDQDCRLHPVAQKKPNELGLYDMSGNALEFCSDYYNPTFYSHLRVRNPLNDSGVNVDGMGWMTVMRGRAWNSSENECRNTSRALFVPFAHASGIDGFRPVMEK